MLIGVFVNVVVVGIVKCEGYVFFYMDFLKIGLLLIIVVFLLLYVYIYLCYLM